MFQIYLIYFSYLRVEEANLKRLYEKQKEADDLRRKRAYQQRRAEV